jgi:hypothetical protein
MPTPDSRYSLAPQKTIEAPQAILTLGKHGWWTAENGFVQANFSGEQD